MALCGCSAIGTPRTASLSQQKNTRRMKRPIHLPVCMVLLACLAGPTRAADTPSNMGGPPLDLARQSIATQDWPTALERLQSALREQPDSDHNADFHNLMGFVLRHLPTPDMERVFRHYERALALDPSHRQAREYLGEAWLMVGQKDKALEQLQAIEQLCGNTLCDEWKDLQQAIDQHRR